MENPASPTLSPQLCRNCNATLTGEFCHSCGQEHSNAILPLREVAEDILGEYMTFDSKVFRSLKPLLLKPGFLTAEYVAGKRASFLLPSRMYLVIAVIFFFLANTFDPVTMENNYNNVESEIIAVMKEKNLSRAELEVKFDDAVSSALTSAVLAMIPIFSVFLKILFPKRFFAEHLIFSFHFFSFILIILMPALFYEEIFFVCYAIIGIYAVLALRKAYSASWLRAIFSGAAALIFWSVLLTFMFSVGLKIFGFSAL